MAISNAGKVLPGFRRAVLLRGGAGLSDGQLLECYLAHHEETAFAALVRRHGPMVWGVCRRVLPSHHDAEDAFQATFLVFVRKAASVVPREKVANWLHGVAYHTALKARAVAARRAARERHMTAFPEPATTEPEPWHDLGPLLDQEVTRLPDLYRVPVVLCDLEGLTYREAARQLGCPEGTLAARLARARALLAKRLTRQGIVLSGGALVVALSVKAAPACVPAALATATVQAASLFATAPAAAGAISAPVLALTEGVLQTMLVNKIKMAMGALLLVGVLGAGVGAGGVVAQSYGPGRGTASGSLEKKTNSTVALNYIAADDEVTDDDLEKLQRALEKQRMLLEEKEAELAVLKAKLGEARSRQTPAPGKQEDERDALKQWLKAAKNSDELKKLKELEDLKKATGNNPQPGAPANRNKEAERREMLERELADYERILKEADADLAKIEKLKKLRDGRQATDKETDREKVEQLLGDHKKLLKGGDADLAKALAELEAARAQHEKRAQEKQTSSDEIEALKRLEEQVRRWADGKRAIEPEEMKKALAELQRESRTMKFKKSMDTQEQALKAKDAGLAELKRALEELRAKPSSDGKPSKRGADQPQPRKNNADLEDLQKMLKQQQDLLQQKDDEIKKLQDFLKCVPKGKEKQKEKDESPDDEEKGPPR